MIDTDEHNPKEKKHTQSLRDSPSRSKLQMKIDQLYHHGQDLHHSQHIMEHLSAGVQTLESSTDEKLTNGQDGRMRADGYRLRCLTRLSHSHLILPIITRGIGIRAQSLMNPMMIPKLRMPIG
ncbi:hypothetical protein LB505_000237 [Fusarium chuoi]|nr:hypothetical protein LB505_000237 [Fusarium chuoi]